MKYQQPIPIQTLTVIVPCYNEEKYVKTVLDRLSDVRTHPPVSVQLIVVNDGSTDNTGPLLDKYLAARAHANWQVIHLPVNRGKGHAIRAALPFAKGEAVIIQDADLEYNPEDFNQLLEPLQKNEADVVLGSRFRGNGPHRGPFFLHRWVNKIYTRLSNQLTGQKLTDIHTCYKMFRTENLRRIELKENRFGFDPEVIARLSKLKHIRFREVGISYHGRSFAEGKKINIGDGIRAFWCIVRYNIFERNPLKNV